MKTNPGATSQAPLPSQSDSQIQPNKEYALLYASEEGKTTDSAGGIHRSSGSMINRAIITGKDVRQEYLFLRHEPVESIELFYWWNDATSVLFMDGSGYAGKGWYDYSGDSVQPCADCPTSYFDTLGFFPDGEGGWFGRQEINGALQLQFISYPLSSETLEYAMEFSAARRQNCYFLGFGQRPDFSGVAGRMAGTLRCNDPEEPQFHALHSLAVVDFRRGSLEFLPDLENISAEEGLSSELRWSGARFSPDGDKVAVVVADPADPDSRQLWVWSINARQYLLKQDVEYQKLIDCPSSESLLLSVPAWSFSPDAWMKPAWSHDGRWLALGTGDILLINTETGGQRWLTRTEPVLERDPVWSPDDRWIVYTAHIKKSECPDAIVPSELYLLPSDGSGATPLNISSMENAPEGTWDCCAVWRPE
jgi:hypothetical protein